MEKLSIVILTMNEENNIRECLETAKWADEIIVVDDFSADKTIEICKEYTDKIFQRKLNSFSEERRFGDEKASGDWILQLDADQRVTPGLRKRIEEILERGTDCDGFMIYKKNSYLGKWMRYAGWRPEVLIMYRRGMQRYNETRAHEKIILEGKVGHLNAEILHKSYESLSEHCPRIDRYTTWDAQDLWDKGFRLNPFTYPVYFLIKPIYIFFRKYIWQQGFREGVRGYLLSVITAFIVFMNYAKLWEKQKNEHKK